MAIGMRVLVAIAAFLLVVSAIAYPAFPGSAGNYLIFDLSFIAMVMLAGPAPRSHAYLFFTGMLFLGFWLKLMAHMIFGGGFLEPTGNFSGNHDEWDRALAVASAAAIGISVARVIHLVLAARSQSTAPVTSLPHWYVEWRTFVWIASIAAMLILNLLNFQLAFYQTGVDPRLILPMHLNAPLGWLVNIGFAIWFTVLIEWECRRAPETAVRSLLLPIIEALVSSTSALSRSFYILHTIPYFFAIGPRHAAARLVRDHRALRGLLMLWVLCFVISLILVSWLRINIYSLAYEPALVPIPSQNTGIAKPVVGASASNQIIPMLRQVTRLFVDRWIGLEGVLAVSSYRALGYDLLAQAVRENQRTGNDSLYQAISNSPYKASQRFTFLTLPGLVGVLFYSGSLAAVFTGTLLVTLLIVGTELIAFRITSNPLLCSMIAMGMANVACQMNFPYLAGVFLVQLWVAIAFVWLLGRERPLVRGSWQHGEPVPHFSIKRLGQAGQEDQGGADMSATAVKQPHTPAAAHRSADM